MKENIVDVFNQWFDSRLNNVHTILPGKIEEYLGHTERKARVKPLVKLKTLKNESISINPIDNVPVIFPSSGNFNMLWPLQKGDGCLLLFSESPIGNFLNSTLEQDSDSLDRFALEDCICIPGLHSFKNVPTAKSKIEVGDDDSITFETTLGKIKIEPSGNIIFDDGTEPMVLGTTFDNWITSILISIFNAHTHSSPAGGSTGTPSSPLTPPINYLSTFIKGK